MEQIRASHFQSNQAGQPTVQSESFRFPALVHRHSSLPRTPTSFGLSSPRPGLHPNFSFPTRPLAPLPFTNPFSSPSTTVSRLIFNSLVRLFLPATLIPFPFFTRRRRGLPPGINNGSRGGDYLGQKVCIGQSSGRHRRNQLGHIQHESGTMMDLCEEEDFSGKMEESTFPTPASSRSTKINRSTTATGLLLTALLSIVPVTMAQQCISLSGSTTCGAFNTSSVSTNLSPQ
jgi:hypothetical protein